MDEQIRELIDLTRTKLMLTNYYLKDQRLSRRRNLFGETVYLLSMEWVPADGESQGDDDLLPEGAATTEINIQTRRFETVIFVKGKSSADGIVFPIGDAEFVGEWVGRETGLEYGKQFRLVSEKAGEYRFQACINGICVSPDCLITVKHDEKGKLTFYSVNGELPSIDQVEAAAFTLSADQLEQTAQEQLKLVEFPSDEEKKFIPVYAIEEIYVANDLAGTIPFEVFAERRSHLQIGRKLCWESPLQAPFERAQINLFEPELITLEQVFAHERHPDALPISETEQAEAVTAVERFLRQAFSGDSGKWILHTLHREKGYLHAVLRLAAPDRRLFARKLLIILSADGSKALDYFDNQPLLDMYRDFANAERPVVNKERAFEILRTMLELTPVYVYDFASGKYILCCKLDCAYGVHAVTGEMIRLSDL